MNERQADQIRHANHYNNNANAFRNGRPGAAEPPTEIIDFILDRPFLFVITNRYAIPVFAGVVNDP